MFLDVLIMHIFRHRYTKYVLFLFVSLPILYLNIYEVNKPRSTDYLTGMGIVEGWDYNTSRDTSLYILPDNITTVLLPQSFCKTATSLLIIVCSSPSNLGMRQAIRETWGSSRNVSNLLIDLYFLLGETSNSTIEEQVELEFEMHNDIIQEQFIDSYNNLTVKSLMMLKLVKTHCLGKVKYLMKTDDDTFVNIVPLVNFLKINRTSNLLAGYLMHKASPIRDPNSKWNAPYYLYKKKYYPDYLSGTGYVMSIDVVPKLYTASLHTSIYYLEDVYITGMLSQAIYLKPKNNPGFTYLKRSFDPCVYSTAITSHRLNDTEIRQLYTIIRTSNLLTLCKKKKKPETKRTFSFLGLFQ